MSLLNVLGAQRTNGKRHLLWLTERETRSSYCSLSLIWERLCSSESTPQGHPLLDSSWFEGSENGVEWWPTKFMEWRSAMLGPYDTTWPNLSAPWRFRWQTLLFSSSSLYHGVEPFSFKCLEWWHLLYRSLGRWHIRCTIGWGLEVASLAQNASTGGEAQADARRSLLSGFRWVLTSREAAPAPKTRFTIVYGGAPQARAQGVFDIERPP